MSYSLFDYDLTLSTSAEIPIPVSWQVFTETITGHRATAVLPVAKFDVRFLDSQRGTVSVFTRFLFIRKA